MSKPLKFTRHHLLRQTETQRRAIDDERRREVKIPAFADMVRELLDEALQARRERS